MTMLHLFAPPSHLKEAVEYGVIVHRASAASVSRFPAMPRAMLTLTRGEHGDAVVAFHGLTTRPASHAHTGPFEAVGLVLPPETAVRLMGPSTGALVDVAVSWEDMAGRSELDRLHEALYRAVMPAERLRCLQESLQRVLTSGAAARREPPALVRRTCMLVGERGVQASAALGITARQLERRCAAWLGLAPKQLQRITRFRSSLALALQQQRVPDAEAALAAGYYDQSHLAREAQRLAGAPLRELLAAAHADGEWWPLATQRLMPGPPCRDAAGYATTSSPEARTTDRRRR